MVKCLLPVYETNTQFFIYLQSSFRYYSHHPNCIPSSFSSSKSKLIFSKYSLNFPFNPSSKYLCYYLYRMCNKADCAMVAAFYSLCLFFKAIIVASVKSLGHSPVSYMVLISFVSIFKPPSPNNLSTSPGTSSSPVAFLFLISLTAFSTSLCKIYGPFSSVSTSSSGSTSRVSGRLGRSYSSVT